MIAGYEVAARIGRCWHDHHSIYQACGSWGSVASAAAAANLMELGTQQTLHALGIAEFYAPNAPMMRDIDDPAMVKHGIGWGAMTGIISADLASAGFTGIPSIAGFDKYQKWMEDIGTVYHTLDGIGWKKRGYACCSWAHAAMEGARNLVDEHHISIEDIEIVSEDIEGWLVATENNVTVALDTMIDDQLRKEGIAREFVNRIQNLRKQNDYEVTDRIKILYNSATEIANAIDRLKDYIKNETLAETIDFSNTPQGEILKINDENIDIKISRI